ncbi:MAG: hypothetical protein ACLU80_11460 [Dorea sp.]
MKKPGENATLEVGNVDGENRVLSEERMLCITAYGQSRHVLLYENRGRSR